MERIEYHILQEILALFEKEYSDLITEYGCLMRLETNKRGLFDRECRADCFEEPCILVKVGAVRGVRTLVPEGVIEKIKASLPAEYRPKDGLCLSEIPEGFRFRVYVVSIA